MEAYPSLTRNKVDETHVLVHLCIPALFILQGSKKDIKKTKVEMQQNEKLIKQSI